MTDPLCWKDSGTLNLPVSCLILEVARLLAYSHGSIGILTLLWFIALGNVSF